MVAAGAFARYFPHLPLLNRLMLMPPEEDEELAEIDSAIESEPFPGLELVGRQGVAVSPLRPAGRMMFDDRYFDVVAQGEFIDPDTPCRGGRGLSEPHRGSRRSRESLMQPSPELALILFFAGVVILGLELFIPSGGLLFLTASACLLGSLFVAFKVSSQTGLTFVGLVAVLVLVGPWVGFQIWKRSPIGKRMFLEAPPTDVGECPDGPRKPVETMSASGQSYASLLGQVGKTLTPLRPSGMTDFSGRRVDTVAEGVMIERGQYVRVIAIEGNRVLVRRLPEPPMDPMDMDFSGEIPSEDAPLA